MKKGVEAGPTLVAAAFASGGGTNVQALLDYQDKPCPWRLSLVVTDRENAGVLERADVAGITTAIIPAQARASSDVAQDILSVLETHRVEVIFLAGYLRLIPSEVVHRYRRRILNIHPALLPAFGGKGMYGMRVHQAVIDAGVSMTGATVHYVDEEYDRGAIIGQWRIPVEPDDSAEAVAARVLKIEHQLYPLAAEHVCSALIKGRDPGPLDLLELSSTATTDLEHTELGVRMKRALLSVSDKTGILELGTALKDRGWEILSTGGTARTLRESGLEVTNVSEVTKHPEMMDGRVKTLHPAIHAGILARRDNEEDMKALTEHGYGPIDLVAVNLYPFRETIAASDVTMSQAMDKVDIGGPTMIRAAAKSHTQVWVIVDPNDYDKVITAIDGGEASELRRELAAKVFSHISAYDESVAGYLTGSVESQSLPDKLDMSLQRIQTLRYGENPDQQAVFYGHEDPVGLSALRQLHGKELSYNNLLDLDGALLALSPFANTKGAAVCIIKHTTPCGLAVSDTLSDAYEKALASDPMSAFGSAIAVNQEVDAETARLMSALFIECLVAPSFADEAMTVLSQKKNIRLLIFPGTSEGEGAADFIASHGLIPEARSVRSVYGGLLAQTPSEPPSYGSIDTSWKVVTQRRPSEVEMDDLRFAWAAIFSVKSNAILIARDGGVLGIGAGQMSRVDSSKIAVRKADEAGFDVTGSVLASDAFFPFRDGVDAAAEAGVRAVIQPGGSIRDEEVINAADEHGLAMVFTGRRLFRH